jgi:hypothetical protein
MLLKIVLGLVVGSVLLYAIVAEIIGGRVFAMLCKASKNLSPF